ncbi:polysaccharide biosynthesis tyrosine autokinase [Thauera sp. 2A1]|uniref:polysaccharide biosynthesis tyrosine autokinase n=1 Tax=Thauera sp. 2A1 TaxID=2570191 RepID=UPI001291416F|nr:polysaccharide biosynthesis tyrosine autokinase [Thauera sp. 2A1]KAI5912967.1 polysaccharide biosynthesis tyrosine autokinase [Thauera sp. 2A1]
MEPLRNPALPGNPPVGGGNPRAARNDDFIDLGEIVATLLENKWLILAITAAAVALGILVAFTTTPIYRADALLQVEEKRKGIAGLEDIQSLLGDKTSVTAELEILRSRLILGRAAERLNLAVSAEPMRAPLIGNVLARRYSGDTPADAFLGMSSYGWGGERIQLDNLQVAPALLGETLTLVAKEQGAYRLLGPDDELLLQGRVGEAAAAEGVQIFVAALDARPDTRFSIRRESEERVLKAMLESLDVRERARLSGVLEVGYVDSDAALASAILNEILNAYLRQNVEFRSAEAEKTLIFLESQLPLLKSQLDAAEAAYNKYRQTRGSVDLTIETQSVLGSIVAVDNEIVALQQKRDELRQRFTPEHPQVVALDAQLGRLQARRGALDRDVSLLPDTQQTALRLKRDVEVSTLLYTNLLNSAQQLRVARAGTVGDVRVIDGAVTASRPVAPRKALILLLSGVLGVLASLAVVWAKRALRVVVEDPQEIEKELGISVYATVPHSKVEGEIARRAARGAPGQGELLALSRPDDDAVESLRSLRTTLHFALLGSDRGSVLITGPRPGVGKSFVSKNLGAVLAQAGKRVVLVDADLRKGHIHKEFGLPREGGVSDFVTGAADLAAIVRATPQPGFCVVTTGQIPPNPSELLMHPRFEALLHALGEQFDIVIVDTPPVLAVSDAAIIGRHVGATLLVARAGTHPIAELEQAVARLGHAGVQVKGFVFNDMDMTRQRYRYGQAGYQYRYTYERS